MKRALVIFTNDLRLTDNRVIDYVTDKRIDYVPVYIDTHKIAPDSDIFPLNIEKRKFLNECISHLSSQLRALDKELLILKMPARETLRKLLIQERCNYILMSNHRNSPLRNLIESMELEFSRGNIFLEYFQNNFLLDLDDLSFPLTKAPCDFKEFLSKIKGVRLNQAKGPAYFKSNQVEMLLREIEKHELPELVPYKTELNNHFSKFLPFLTIGQLSPAELIHETKKSLQGDFLEAKAEKLLIKQLLKLDFIHLQYDRSSERSFPLEELNSNQEKLLRKWIKGETNSPFINAIMHKLKSKSMISLTSKRHVIQYYIHVLELPSYYGHKYFENQLLEYDSALNFYLWKQYEEPPASTEELQLKMENESRRLDPQSAFVEFWN